MRRQRATVKSVAHLKPSLDRLYESFNSPDSAVDPIQIVRRYDALDDREVVAFIAAGLAFGRVASVMASIDAVCRVLGAEPARFVRAFDPAQHGARLRPLVHRWTKGNDFVALIWILKQLLREHGSIEHALAGNADPSASDVGAALEQFVARARAVDLRPAYGRVPTTPGVCYFFARPSTGSACKRLNLFLRWMVRRDGVDPGGWTALPTSQLVVPLDTHTIRIGRCLRSHAAGVARLEDGGGDHGVASRARSDRSRAVRLRPLPPQHDGRLRVRHEARAAVPAVRRRRGALSDSFMPRRVSIRPRASAAPSCLTLNSASA